MAFNYKQNTASKFFRPLMTAEELRMAMEVTPFFLAYLQSKIEAYATDLVETPLAYHPDPKTQVAAIIEYERRRNYVTAYEELLNELLAHQPQSQPE